MPHIPKKGQQDQEVNAERKDESGLRKTVSVGKISLKDWNVKPEDVYKQMFGREAVKDDVGIVVHARPAGRDS
jgi:hypothetical protein